MFILCALSFIVFGVLFKFFQFQISEFGSLDSSVSNDLALWLFDLRNVFDAALRGLFAQFQFPYVVLVLLTRLE